MNLNFPCFYVETEEQRNNNDSQNHCFRFTFTRRGESQEEIVKFYKEVNNRQDSRRSVDAANCNYARRSLKRGWEREEHDTRGQREREGVWFTPLNRLVPAIPFVLGRWIRASTYDRLTYDYSWKIGGREESRDCLRYLWRWRVSLLARHYPLSTNYSLRVNKAEEGREKGREKNRTYSTRNKLFIIPTRIPTIIYPWSILRTDEKLRGETVRVTNNRYPRLARSRATWIFWYRDEKWRRANARGPPVLRANGLLH